MKYLLSSWLILKAEYFDYTVNFQKQCAYTAALYSIQPYSTVSLIGAKVFPSTSLIFVISSRTLKRAGKTAQTVRRRDGRTAVVAPRANSNVLLVFWLFSAAPRYPVPGGRPPTYDAFADVLAIKLQSLIPPTSRQYAASVLPYRYNYIPPYLHLCCRLVIARELIVYILVSSTRDHNQRLDMWLYFSRRRHGCQFLL